jgi:hypothetical protein
MQRLVAVLTCHCRVEPGIDPAIQAFVDARVKPAHDHEGIAAT